MPWLFPASRRQNGILNPVSSANWLKRVLKPVCTELGILVRPAHVPARVRDHRALRSREKNEEENAYRHPYATRKKWKRKQELLWNHGGRSQDRTVDLLLVRQAL